MSHHISKEIGQLGLSVYSDDELRRLSVQRITTALTYDNLELPVPGGLYDTKLGPIGIMERCTTCSLRYKNCPGHMGHIELRVPVYNPMMFSELFRLMSIKCLYCHRFRALKSVTFKFAVQFQLLAAGCLTEAMEIEDLFEQVYDKNALSHSKKKKKKKKRRLRVDQLPAHRDELPENKDDDDDVDGEDDTDSDAYANNDERVRELYKRFRDTVIRQVNEWNDVGSVNHDPPTASILEYRERLMAQFLASAPAGRRCGNCQARNPRLLRDSYRIVEMPLTEKRKQTNKGLGVTRDTLYDDDDGNDDAAAMKMLAAVDTRVDDVKADDNDGDDDEDAAAAVANLDGDDDDDDSDIEELEEHAARGRKRRHSAEDSDDTRRRRRRRKHKKKKSKRRATDATGNDVYGDHAADEEEEDKGSKRKLMYTSVVERHMQLLNRVEHEMFPALVGTPSMYSITKQTKANYSAFFFHVIPVIPNKFRPPTVFGGEQFQHPMNMILGHVITVNEEVTRALSESLNDLERVWKQLQDWVTAIYCGEQNVASKAKALPGLRAVLDKKAGMFRSFMMGKRVNFAARSVISPDPLIATNQIGVPNVFARTLTYPEPVNVHNVRELSAAVMNGPHVWPGANSIEYDDGSKVDLSLISTKRRYALANTLLAVHDDVGGKKVLRHLRDGDIVLMNRQPTLHKPSIMGHKVKVLTGDAQTFRMHYANCNTYNADFDGDEMNLHFPQDPVSRAEAYGIAIADQQYVKPTDGTPLRGLIQDHVVTGVLLTKLDTFFTRIEFQQLFYAAISVRSGREETFITPIPCIMKPREMWSGKQVMSAILKWVTNSDELMYKGKCKVPESLWAQHKTESTVIFRNSELLCGVLDKSQFGASKFGVIHLVHEMYGGGVAGDMLSHLGRLFTIYLQTHGFTVGLDDMLVTAAANAERGRLVGDSAKVGTAATTEFCNDNGRLRRDAATAAAADDDDDDERVREIVQTKLTDIKSGDANGAELDNVVKAALIGTTSQIIDECLPHGQYKSFPDNCMSLMTVSGAKGSSVNFSQISCLLGQQELEGRRVPLMPSGKTLPSFKAYDPSPRAGGYVTDRFITGIRPPEYFFHCMAGREGLVDTAVKTSRSGYLQRCLIKHLESLRVHYDNTVRDADGGVIQFLYGEDCVDVSKSAYLREFSTHMENVALVVGRLSDDVAMNLEADEYVKQRWQQHLNNVDVDPIIADCNPSAHFGAVSNAFADALFAFMAESPPSAESGITEDAFNSLMSWKYQRSLVDPGEAVGILAAQSVGEPSTQMTLNTFHLAGHGGANVTLGIPRLREIIMVASKNMKTPVMELPIRGENQRKAVKRANALRNRLQRLRFEDFVTNVSIMERLSAIERIYDVTIDFLPLDDQRMIDNNVSVEQLKTGLSISFFKQLEKALNKALGAHMYKNPDDDNDGDDVVMAVAQDASDSDSIADGEGLDADQAKQLQHKRPDAGYDDDDDDDDGIDIEVSDADIKICDDDDDDGGDDESAVPMSYGQYIDRITCKVTKNVFQCEMRVKTIIRDEKLLLTSVLDQAISESVIRQIAGITDCFVLDGDDSDSGRVMVQTNGVNFAHVWREFNAIDVNSIKSNDIHAILMTYGVEACRTAIVEQVRAVFAVYGISVDHRHIGLIADYMTYFGGYRALSRGGISSGASPFQKITFETSTNFLKLAALNGAVDDMVSPSSRIVVGLPIACGTGSFDLFQQF